jgi:hypothetical protein
MGTNYNPCAVTDGLKLYLDAQNVNSYPGTGTTWYDISGNSNHATFVNSPVYYANPTANMTFNGTNAYMTIARSSSMSPTAGISQEIWFKYDSSLTNIHFTGVQYGNWYGNSYGIWSETTNLTAGVNISGTLNYFSSSVSFIINTWYHCVHTYDGTIQKLYLNGNLLNSMSTSGSIAYDVNNTLVTIGSDFQGVGYNSGVGWFLNGKLAQVRIYDRALSLDEINQNYNSTKKRYSPEENIVTDRLICNLDTGNTRSYSLANGVVWNDISGNSYTAALTNSPAYSTLNGGYFTFDGSNDYAPISTIPATFWTGGSWSVEFCIYSNNPTSGDYGILGTDGQVHFLIRGGSACLGLYNNDVSSTFQIPTNSWTHIVFAYRADNYDKQIYINGVLNNSSIFTAISVIGTGTQIGKVSWAYGYFNGRIAFMRFYQKLLSATEITQNYNAIKNRYGLS